MLIVTVVHGLTGYASRWTIVLSGPVIAAALVTLMAWVRFRHQRTVRSATQERPAPLNRGIFAESSISVIASATVGKIG